jgi:peroxiredoxin
MLRRRRLCLAGLLVAALLVVGGCSGGSNAVDQTAGGQYRYVGVTTKGETIPLDKRKTAGDATATLLDTGAAWSLDSLRGQVVVLNYWATYCGPCVTETPAFDKLYRATKSDGVTFVGVNVKDLSKSKSKAFIQDLQVTYPIVWDQTGATLLQIGRVPSVALPQTVVIDRQGKVAAVYSGAVASGDLQPVLEQLVAGK